MAISHPSKSFSIIVMVGVTALGLAAGYVGGLSGQQYINYIQQFVPSQEQIQKPKGAHVLGLSEIIEHTSPSMVSLFRLEDKDTTDGIYPLPTKQSYVGDAIAVSADGWVVLPSSLLAGVTEKKGANVQYVAVYKQTVYSINQTIPDTSASVSFLKLEGAPLRPASFAWEQSMVGLVSAYSISSVGAVSSLYITQPHYAYPGDLGNYTLRTNILSKRFNPDMVFSAVGSAVVTENGDVIGIADRMGIIPSDHFRTSLEQVLTNASIKRSSVNVSYYDNAWMPYTQFSKPASSAVGATIIDPGSTISIDPLLGLKKGDVVISVNNENIDINRSFSDVLSRYKVGSTITLGVIRDGNSLEIPLILK